MKGVAVRQQSGCGGQCGSTAVAIARWWQSSAGGEGKHQSTTKVMARMMPMTATIARAMTTVEVA